MASVSNPQESSSNGQSSHPFTCNTCQVAFRSSDVQRKHMQTDWHRYNLKRRVASLPPLSAEVFNEKVLANKASAAATAARATFEKSCGPCQKTFYSENSFTNHLKSQKHKANAAKRPGAEYPEKDGDDVRSMTSSAFSLGDPVEGNTGSTSAYKAKAEDDAELASVVDDLKQASLGVGGAETPRPPTASVTPRAQSGAATPAAPAEDVPPPTACLFCNYVSPKFHLNVDHMGKHHGMFIPEREFLVDLDGLVLHLERKIKELHMCLYCSQTKRNTEGVQTHMLDKGHCMIAFASEEEMIEIGQFYDFRSTYSDDDEYDTTDDEDEISDSGRLASKLGARRSSSGVEEDEGWETDSVSDVPTDEITSVPIDDFSHRYANLSKHKHHSHSDPRPHRNLDGFHSRAHPTPHAVYHDDFELHMPSGRTAGHRSLRNIWRQNLRNYPSASERAEAHQRTIEGGDAEDEEEEEQNGAREGNRGRQLATRANGGLGMVGVTEAKKQEVSKAEKRERTRQVRAAERQRWGNEKQNNNQKHFRDPLLQ